MSKECINKEDCHCKEGEFTCPHCKGDGLVELSTAPSYIKTCPLCNGSGIVDWVKKAMGYTRTKTKNEINWKINWTVPTWITVKPKGVKNGNT